MNKEPPANNLQAKHRFQDVWPNMALQIPTVIYLLKLCNKNNINSNSNSSSSSISNSIKLHSNKINKEALVWIYRIMILLLMDLVEKTITTTMGCSKLDRMLLELIRKILDRLFRFRKVQGNLRICPGRLLLRGIHLMHTMDYQRLLFLRILFLPKV